MSGRDVYGRRRASPLRWLGVAVLLAGAAALGAVAERAWQRAAAAEAEIVALRAEVQAAREQAAGLAARVAALEARDPAGPLAAVRAELDALRAELDGLRQEAGPAGGGSGAASGPPPEVRLAVARQTQGHSLSCESAAASMAAQYHGVALTEADVLAALPRNDNPYLGFRGNVDGTPGGLEDYGVYAQPVAAVLNSRGLRATLLSEGVAGIEAALARGNPVVAWITYNCIVSTPVARDVAGESVPLVPYQHAVVVTGYDAGGVWANDPYDGGEDYYPLADFERALGYFGHMAIEVAAP